MAASYGSDDRRVIPRWRSAAAAARRRELSSARAVSAEWATRVAGELRAKELEWRKSPNSAIAGELATLALLANDPSRGVEAARALLPTVSYAWPLLQKLLQAPLLRSSSLMAVAASPPTKEAMRLEAASVRARITIDPRNAIAWTDMALTYAMLGQSAKAEGATRIAIALAPHNRFVLRSGARLYVHLGDPERAHDIVVREAVNSGDPWLIATEIAVADVARQSPRCGRQGRTALDGGQYRDRDLAELASALATLELEHGRTRQARRLFRRSLREPNDNALAQVEWAERTVGELGSRGSLLADTSAYEAQTRQYQRLGRWDEAVSAAVHWQGDEPYSEMAAAWSTAFASVANEDYKLAAMLAQQGLLANPRSPLLLNNLAYSLIESGELDRAETALSDLPKYMEKHTAIASMATTGLLAFRRGRPTDGRHHYQQAIRWAKASGFRDEEAMASVMVAGEEVRLGSAYALSAIGVAQDAVGAIETGLAALVLNRIRHMPGSVDAD